MLSEFIDKNEVDDSIRRKPARNIACRVLFFYAFINTEKV